MKFSIITVVKNDKDNILKTIRSVKNQKFQNYEYIIIDGKSNDGTSKIIKNNIKVEKKFIHIIKKDKNLYQALNNGIKIAKGKYILIIHSGDIFWDQNILKIIDKEINNYDAISGNIMFQSKNNFSRYWKYRINKLSKYNCFKIAHTSLVIKRELINKLKRYNINYNISSDTDFILRFSLVKNLKFKYVDKIFVIMKTGGLSSSSSNFFTKVSQDLKIYRKYFNEKFIFIYFYKLIYKFYKLFLWKILN